MFLRISHDKESGALYFKLREGKLDHAEDFSERVDVYVEGNVFGLEALSFEKRGGKGSAGEDRLSRPLKAIHRAARKGSRTPSCSILHRLISWGRGR
ncbi:MAG: hypothetical protein M3338_05080, partial [Actinomycetota bacterium]|nr:hypothetical protein [Actinomycetota bacterium]